MAEWAEQRGFTTRIVERRFASNFQIEPEEPQVALCGVDNAAARAALEDAGFAQIIEAGLGRGNEEYLAFQMHCFPAYKSARHRWGGEQQRFDCPIIIDWKPGISVSCDERIGSVWTDDACQSRCRSLFCRYVYFHHCDSRVA
jgi:hypothetical protein